MRRLLVPVIALAAVAFGAIAAFACGDKLMLLIGHARYSQVYNGHPVSILAFTRQNSPVPGIVSALEREPALKRGGPRFHRVDDLLALDEALKAGKYDLVLADLMDTDGVVQHLQTSTSQPIVLPVVYNSTKAEVKAVERKFHCVLKAPGTPVTYLAAIDDAMEVSLKARSVKTADR